MKTRRTLTKTQLADSAKRIRAQADRLVASYPLKIARFEKFISEPTARFYCLAMAKHDHARRNSHPKKVLQPIPLPNHLISSMIKSTAFRSAIKHRAGKASDAVVNT